MWDDTRQCGSATEQAYDEAPFASARKDRNRVKWPVLSHRAVYIVGRMREDGTRERVHYQAAGTLSTAIG